MLTPNFAPCTGTHFQYGEQERYQRTSTYRPLNFAIVVQDVCKHAPSGFKFLLTVFLPNEEVKKFSTICYVVYCQFILST
jgi:hypothetical protein